MSPLKFIHKQRLYKKKRDPLGHWKNRWIQTPQRILMDPCIKQAPVLSKRCWIISWPLAYNRFELDCIRKIINFWYTFGWKWRVFVTIYDCRTHVPMTSSVDRTDLNFKISVALVWTVRSRSSRSASAGLFRSLLTHRGTRGDPVELRGPNGAQVECSLFCGPLKCLGLFLFMYSYTSSH